MTDIAIRVENLSKLYHIGAAQKRHDTLRDAISDLRLQSFGKLRMTIADCVRFHRKSKVENHNSDDTIWALKDVSFEVKRSEVVGIIGRNGAGKSTLLKILSRITEPTQGRAIINGRVGSLLEVGTGFHPELTGRENIYLNGAILGMKKTEIERKFDEIVAFAEVEKFLDTPVKHYSSGMYVRLAFAVAAHLEPEILLVDEVLAVGDAAFQKKCLGKIGDVAKEGRTVLFVSHNMAAVQKMCRSSAVLANGELAFWGDTALAVERYLARVPRLDTQGPWGFQRPLKKIQSSGEVLITGFEMLSADGRPLTSLRTGSSLRLRIYYEANRQVIAPGFIVIFTTQSGAELCRLSNMPISGYPIEHLLPKGRVELYVHCLPFTGGRYYISLGIARANVEWIARLDDIVWFEVEPTDWYGSGLALDNTRGLVVVSHKWSVL